MKESTAFKLVKDELDRATEKAGPFNSAHEGYAVLLEEADELWDEVKKNTGTTHRGVSEAVQTAAMALRYLIDLCPEDSAVKHEKKVEKHYTYSYGSYGGYSG